MVNVPLKVPDQSKGLMVCLLVCLLIGLTLSTILDRQVERWETQSPSPKMVLYRYTDSGVPVYGMLTVHDRGSEHSTTPMPGVALQSPLRDLVPIESSAGPSQDKGKGRAVKAMEEGKLERGQLVSLTISEYKGVFHGGGSCFVYDWIDDAHGDSSPEGPRESNWLTNQSYMDASEKPIE
jgi:hypothetical protein